MKNLSALEDLKFDIEDGNYSELADALEYWATIFWEGTLEDAYGDCLAYLLYNMSKEMRQVDETSV
jgi:hypothetical protein